jgi:GntR family transcriptional regulator
MLKGERGQVTPPDDGVGLEELENVSLSSRARAAILEGILDDRFDGRLPSEDRLAEMLNVSRTTVRTAVQSLEHDGLIKRRRAVGTTINRHVSPQTLALQRLVGWDWLLEERGHAVSVEISWERRIPENAIASDLPWSPDVECLIIEKRYHADGALAIYLRDYIPVANLTSDTIEEPVDASVFDFSRKYCMQRITHAVVEIVPKVQRRQKDSELTCPVGTPFIRLHETHHAGNADVVGWSFIDIDDSFIRLEVFRGNS